MATIKRRRPIWCRLGFHFWNWPKFRSHCLMQIGWRQRKCFAVQCKATKIEFDPHEYKFR